MNMMKTFKSALLVATLVLGTHALASEATPSLTSPVKCGLAFTAKGGGFQFFAGHYKLTGKGEVKCIDIAGVVTKMPVKVTLGGRPLAACIAFGKFNVAGVATALGYVHDTNALIGTYGLAGAEAVLGVGGGAQAALRVSNHMVSLDGMLEAIKGIGFEVGLSTMKIEAAD